MKKGKFANGKRGFGSKSLALMLALVLLVGVAVGGTIAWLTDTSVEVKNTFTPSDINIELKETKTDFKMVPGNTIDKDPVVTVKPDSEACWLFVKVEESNNYSTYLDGYVVASDWTPLNTTKYPGVYYCSVDAATAKIGTQYQVLGCKENPVDSTCTGCVKVLDTVTKANMEAIDGVAPAGTADSEKKSVQEAEINNQPTLTFTAYAVQKDNITSAQAAWETLFPAIPSNP